MRVLIIAPFVTPECTANLISKAFRALGIEVEEYCYRSRAKMLGTVDDMNFELTTKVQDYGWKDLVLVIKGEAIFPWVLKHTKAKVAYWFFDFDNFVLPENLVLFCYSSKIDYLFLMCYPWVEEFRKLGINAYFLPQATDPGIYFPMVPEEKYRCDVAFMGSWKPGRQEILEEINKEFFLKVYGNGWDSEEAKNTTFSKNPPVYLKEFNVACASAKTILNITPSKDWPIYEKTFSQRVYMVMAAGRYLVTDKIPGMPLIWLSNYENLSELKKLLSLTIADNNLRYNVGTRAREEIIKGHTYHHRIVEMLKCMRLLPSALKNIPA